MAEIQLQGTKFSFTVLPNGEEPYWAKTEICIKNEYVHYQNIDQDITRDEIENLVFSMHRLLAGAYAREYSVSFEKAGIAVDLYPTQKEGVALTKEERRKEDCRMLFQVLMKSSDKSKLLGGVYSFIFHRKELAAFSKALWEEVQSVYGEAKTKEGTYLFVGVSPKGYEGCNYWYLDPTGTTNAGEYVWVRMGRHNTEQIVYVDSVRCFDKEDAPYPPEVVKQVLRKATETEVRKVKKEWAENEVE